MIKAVCNVLYDSYKKSHNGRYGAQNIFDAETSLKNILLHAYTNVRYYQAVFKEIGLISHDEVDLSKFNKIPILTKKIIHDHYDELLSGDYGSRGWYINNSGGSTGEPLRFVQDEMFRAYADYRERYYFSNILNVDQHKIKKVILWGSEKDLLKQGRTAKQKIVNWFQSTVFLNSFRMSPSDMGRYINVINSYKPGYIRGYAGSLFQLAKYIEDNNLSVYSPEIVVSSAESLRKDMRETIERVFRTHVYDFYGSREVGGIAGECKSGLMHIFSFWNHVEILDKGVQVKEGESGSVIVTNLFNYSMPFIRYDIGDMAALGPKKCLCGNPLPTLRNVAGRVTDHFTKRDGTIVPAEFFIHFIGVVCNKGFIKKFQVVQEDYDRIKISVVLEKAMADPDKRDIEEKIRLVMGDECRIIWSVVDEIEKTINGKYVYTKSLVTGQTADSCLCKEGA